MPQIRNKYRYTFSDRKGVALSSPLGETRLSISYEKENEKRADYIRKPGGKVVFVGADFERLFSFEQTKYRCSEIIISIERMGCNGAWEPFFTGSINLNKGKWDLDECNVEVPIENIDQYTCMEVSFDEEINIFDATSTRRTVLLRDPRLTIETLTCYTTNCANPYEWCGTEPNPSNGGWIVVGYDISRENMLGSTICNGSIAWAREVIEVPAAEIMDSSWIFIEDVGANKKYARPAKTYNCQFSQYGDTDGGYGQYSMSCGIVGNGGSSLSTIDNGVLLGDVITYMLNRNCNNYVVKSDFFQINPDVVSTTNYVTGRKSTTAAIILFQKSDVKRPNTLFNASKQLVSFEKLMDWIIDTFNVQYRIYGNVMRIEHVSWFSRSSGFDLTSSKWGKYIKNKRKYSYDNEKIPKQETFSFMESGGADFTGMPIIYNNDCVTKAKGTAKVERKVDKITTDIELCLNNPDPDSKIVSDDGLVMISCELVSGSFVIMSEAPVLAPLPQLNNVLGWALLHRDFHRHNRPYINGVMNNVQQNFISSVPTKKGEKITIPICCEDEFDPFEKIKTNIGVGFVDKAEINLTNSTIDLEISYPADLDLVQNETPIAVADSMFTFINTAMYHRLASNDIDAENGPLKIEIDSQPSHGTVVIASMNGQDGFIKYTPTAGYTGPDAFIYRVRDIWNERSNAAVVLVTVRPANASPQAITDSYEANKDTVLNVAVAQGVLGNDTDDFTTSLRVISFQFPTAQGGSISVNQNGSFVYTPPAAYTGNDSFTYTIQDGSGLTATATVNINVFNPLGSHALDDYYNAVQNTVLNISAPAVLANDASPNGGLHIPSAPITISTAQGGSITLQANGSFAYTPPAGYIGNDTVNYAVQDSLGNTDTGTIHFNVAPIVYVKLVTQNLNYQDLTIQCGQPPMFASGGHKQTLDHLLKFYSDSAGTLPLNVSGFNLTVNVRESVSYNFATPVDFDYGLSIPNGTEWMAFDDYPIEWYEHDCFGEYSVSQSATISLLAGNGYQII